MKILENKNVAYLFILINILLQIILFGKYINTDVISALHPFFGDSTEYVSTTEYWIKSNNFVSTFNSGWRLPAYSTFMLVVYKLANILHLAPLILLRITQLVFSSFIPFFSYKSILNFSKSHKTALLGALIICFYYPFYYYTPAIGAESISLFFLSILFYQVSFIGDKDINIKNIFYIALNLGVLIYLKPNHLFFSIPIGILLINKSQLFSGKIFTSIVKPSILALFIIILLLPWVLFISFQNKMFIPLATTSGVDMVIGTGIAINPNNRDTTSLPYKYETKYNLEADTIFVKNKTGLSIAQMNKAFQAEAISIWKSRPWITFKYGLVKIAHSMGFGFRGPKDYFSFLVIVPCLLILIFSPQFRKKNKNITVLISILFILFWIQCFIYFGDMRLRILMLDMPTIYFLSIFLYDFYKKRFRDSIF